MLFPIYAQYFEKFSALSSLSSHVLLFSLTSLAALRDQVHTFPAPLIRLPLPCMSKTPPSVITYET